MLQTQQEPMLCPADNIRAYNSEQNNWECVAAELDTSVGWEETGCVEWIVKEQVCPIAAYLYPIMFLTIGATILVMNRLKKIWPSEVKEKGGD